MERPPIISFRGGTVRRQTVISRFHSYIFLARCLDCGEPVDNAIANICVHVVCRCVLSSLGYLPETRPAESQDTTGFSENCWTVLSS